MLNSEMISEVVLSAALIAFNDMAASKIIPINKILFNFIKINPFHLLYTQTKLNT